MAEAPEAQPRGPLDGLLVADLSRILAGPYASMLLSDMGAQVVKVEGRGGDDTRTWLPPVRGEVSTYYLGVNRGQALGRPRPQGPRRPGPGPGARAPRRRGHRELQARRAGPLRPRLRHRERGQPPGRLRLHHRLRRRGGGGAARLRPHGPGHVRAHEPDRRPRRLPLPRRHLGVRRHERHAGDHRHPRRAHLARRDRHRPARRGQPALDRAVGPGQPHERLGRRRHGPVPDGQRAPEPVPLRAAAGGRRRAHRHRRQRRAVRQAVRGARRARSCSRTRASPTTRTGPRTARRCARCWSSGS